MATLQTIRAAAYKNRVEANKEIRARKATVKKAIDQVREKLNAGKLNAKQAADQVNAKIEVNNSKIQELRSLIKAAGKDKNRKEALRALIEGIRGENSTYRGEVKKIKSDFANKRADTQAKIAEVKKQTQFKEA